MTDENENIPLIHSLGEDLDVDSATGGSNINRMIDTRSQKEDIYNMDEFGKIYENKITSKLCLAVTKGDHLEVESALNDGEDPNTCMDWEFADGPETVPVLTVAVKRGDLKSVTILLEAEAKIEYRGEYHQTPLATAIAGGYTEIVEKLLTSGADVNGRDSSGSLPIHYGASSGCIKITEMLKANGSSLDSVNTYGFTPLHYAAWCGHDDMAEWLVQQRVHAIDNKGFTAADIAENYGFNELAARLRSCIVNIANAPTSPRTLKPNTAVQNQKYKKKVYVLNYINFPDKWMRKYGDMNENICLGRRIGASKDSENLRSTFEKLGYEFNLHEDMTTEETNKVLDGIQQDKCLEFLLLFVLSHGVDRETFFTSDGNQYNLEEIQYRFTNTNCPQLMGNAKIIFSNFCRGKNIEKILPDSMSVRNETPHNMITIHASHKGFQAMRSTVRGTLFVYNLCEVLKEQPILSIQEMFNEIYSKMEAGEGQTPEMEVSAPFANFNF